MIGIKAEDKAGSRQYAYNEYEYCGEPENECGFHLTMRGKCGKIRIVSRLCCRGGVLADEESPGITEQDNC